MAARGRKGTWPQALVSLGSSVLLILGIRWAFFEPYVIPSGSMLPSLLVNDHIMVNKFAYGLRVPFTSRYFVRFALPARGDVIVFRSVDDPSVYLVKRVAGLPGDEVAIGSDGELVINGKSVEHRLLSESEIDATFSEWPEDERQGLIESFDVGLETLGANAHLYLHERDDPQGDVESFKVPPDTYFMVGDNRDNSSDSRVWGALPFEQVLGRASAIWLSCEETLPDASQLCDPKTIRWDRVFKGIR